MILDNRELSNTKKYLATSTNIDINSTKTEFYMANLKKQQYLYNPHNHVKIWLSNRRGLFMHDENQMRLIEMRYKNPNDRIHLVYDSSLLDVQATVNLHQFCSEHSIIPVDANEFGKLLKASGEKKLYEFYKDEINHLKDGEFSCCQ